MQLNVNLTNNEPEFNINCVGQYSCGWSRAIISSDNISEYNAYGNVNCNGNNTCFDATFVFIGFNQVNINCDGYEACTWTGISLTSWDINEKHNKLSVNCYRGVHVCRQMQIIGLATSNVNVTCHSNTYGEECRSTQVYCPINPFKNANNYSISNMDPNSCYADLNFPSIGSRIYAIYGVPQTSIISPNSNGLTELLCEFDWFDERAYFHGTSDIESFCIDGESIKNNMLNRIVNNQITLKLSDPNSNEISCLNSNNDCVIYAMQQYNPIKNIICPNGDYICSVVR